MGLGNWVVRQVEVPAVHLTAREPEPVPWVHAWCGPQAAFWARSPALLSDKKLEMAWMR